MKSRYTTIWTPREDAILTSLYPLASRDEIERSLPRHTYAAIYHRAYVLGIKRLRRSKKSARFS